MGQKNGEEKRRSKGAENLRSRVGEGQGIQEFENSRIQECEAPSRRGGFILEF
jgi:hypothetical protein